jgi:hypothetical protein
VLTTLRGYDSEKLQNHLAIENILLKATVRQLTFLKTDILLEQRICSVADIPLPDGKENVDEQNHFHSREPPSHFIQHPRTGQRSTQGHFPETPTEYTHTMCPESYSNSSRFFIEAGYPARSAGLFVPSSV